MGGKGSGGLRVGAGRKSKAASAVWLGGNAGKRSSLRAKPRQASPDPVEMPSDLPELHQEVWVRLAPHAIRERTLTSGTVAAFRDLCEAIVVRDGLLSAIHQSGYVNASGEKHPLLADYRGMYQRVETGMVKFRLAPLGKPMVDEAPAVVDPFDEFEPKGGVQ